MPLWTPPRPHPDIPGTREKVLTPAHHQVYYRYDHPGVWGSLSEQGLHNPFRDFDFDERADEVHHGWDHAEEADPDVVKRFHDRYQHHLAKAHPAISVPTAAIHRIVKSGRIQSQFETGTSRGILDTDLRARTEHSQFGYPMDHPDHARPIYGSLTAHPYTDASTASYGNHTFVLHKPHIWHRTTFSGGDSLESQGILSPTPVNDYARHAVPVDHLGLSADQMRQHPSRLQRWIGAADPEDMANAFWNRGEREHPFAYPEAQYHGGVPLHAIRYAILRSPGRGERHLMHPDVAHAARSLESAGVPWVHTVAYRKPDEHDEHSGYVRGGTPLPPNMPEIPQHLRPIASRTAAAGSYAPTVTWQRLGGEAYLLGLSQPGPGGLAMGQVADVHWGQLHPPMPIASILARGYWQRCPQPVSSADVMELIR